MPLRNTAEAYGSLSKFLHWAIVLLIVGQWLLAEAPRRPATARRSVPR